jgi:hypothetical protein
MIIGITGVARCGKDTFYSLLNRYLEDKHINTKRLAFADDLKTEGKYWTSLLDPKVLDLINNNIIPVVTDVRYIEYKDDEYSWLKSHSGVLIHLSRRLDDGSLVPPANIEEKSNDNKLKVVADFNICWETCQDTNCLYELMQKNLKNIYERIIQK